MLASMNSDAQLVKEPLQRTESGDHVAIKILNKAHGKTCCEWSGMNEEVDET